MSEEPKRIKLFFLGEEFVGKTSIIALFERKKIYDDYNDLQHTVGINLTFPELKFSNNKTINLTNFDVSGEEKYLEHASWLLDEFSFIVLVYSVDSKYTFEKLQKFWFSKLQEKGLAQKIIAIAGNKSDYIGRDIKDDKAKIFADENDVLFFNTSAKNYRKVVKLFEGIIKKINGWEEDVKLTNISYNGWKEKEEEEKKEIRGGKKNQLDKKKKKGPGCC